MGLPSTITAFALALTLLSVWVGSPIPLALGAVVSLGLLLRSAGPLTLPNAVTFGRLLVLVGALLFASGDAQVVLPCALLAWILDGLDGWLARRRGQVTPLGALLDQETDAALVLLLCVELVVTRNVGPWVLIAGLLRYVLVFTRMLATRPIAERRSSLGRLIFGFSYLSLTLSLEPAFDLASAVLLPTSVGLLMFSFVPDFVAVARARGQ